MATQIREAVIVEAVRTPVGRRNGSLRGWHAVDLLAVVLAEVVARTGIDPALIDDVIAGCVSQVGEQSINVARNAALAAGFPETVVGTTIDRQCGSAQQAAHFAAQGVMSGAYDIAIACGVESMTRVPMGSNVTSGPGQMPKTNVIATPKPMTMALERGTTTRAASRPSSEYNAIAQRR